MDMMCIVHVNELNNVQFCSVKIKEQKQILIPITVRVTSV